MEYFGYKSIPAEVVIKDLGAGGKRITGYAAAFDNKDSDGDIIQKDAFKRTLAENGPKGKNRIKMLYNHNWDKMLGKPDVLVEDDKGLYFEIKLSRTSYGNDVVILYEDEVIDMHSIGYNVVKDEYNKERDATILKELKLYEFSAVGWGANEETPYLGMKSRADKKKCVERLEKLVKLARRDLTDETHYIIEAQIMQIMQGLKALIDEPVGDAAHREPVVDTAQLHGEIIDMLRTNTNIMKSRR